MIAHRLETAISYAKKIMVMDQGECVEFDSAYKLLVDNEDDQEITADTIFASMVKALSSQQQKELLTKARRVY